MGIEGIIALLPQILAHQTIIFLSKNFPPKVQNVAPKSPILDNFGAKLKF